MQNKLKVNPEELRFISPYGEIISSPEGHVHAVVIAEKNLSKKTGFEAIIDVIQKGYAIIASIKNELMITHTCELTASQRKAISSLETALPTYKVSIMQDA